MTETGNERKGARRRWMKRLAGSLATLWALARRGKKAVAAKRARRRADRRESQGRTVASAARKARPASQPAPEVADERTMRRAAEAEAGGLSSEESAKRYATGENPGGIHQKAVRDPTLEDPEEEVFEAEDDVPERRERRPRRDRTMAAHRRGA